MGDVVDRRKYISYRTAHDFRKRFIGKFQELGIDLHIIIGNHDTYYKNTNEVNSMEELVGADRFKIYSEPEIVEFDGLPILLMPWINANNYDKSIKALSETKADFLMGHLDRQNRGEIKTSKSKISSRPIAIRTHNSSFDASVNHA